MRSHYDFVGKIMPVDRTVLKLNYTHQTMVSPGISLIIWDNPRKNQGRGQKAEQKAQQEETAEH